MLRLLCCAIFAIVFAIPLSAQSVIEENIHSYYIYYPVSIDILDEGFNGNVESLAELNTIIDRFNANDRIELLSVTFGGAVSPEGGEAINRRLSRGRLNSIESYIRSRIEIPEDIITRNDNYIDWVMFEELLNASDIANKDEIFAIVDDIENPTAIDDDAVVASLRRLGNAKWNELNSKVFSKMRYGYVRFHVREVVSRTAPADIATEAVRGITEQPAQQPLVAIAPVSVGPNRHLYLKTDIPAYGLLIPNIGVEVDLLPHLSFDMPFYYSGWNYSGETTKFRTATLRPELRFWPKAENQGLFVGAHFGLSWFNIAVGDEFRYQDKDGKTPAIGGGLSLGYRLPISRNNRWHLEMGVGAGVYKVDYDIFHNADSTANGVFIENRSKNWFGLDHASISLSYMFDLEGGKR